MVHEALDQRQIDAALRARVFVRVALHQLGRAREDAPHAELAHGQMMCLFRQHESARARERVEAGFGERGELILAVAVGERGEAEEVEPRRDRAVEGAQYARVVCDATLALEQRLRLLAPVAPEVREQQVDHRPQVARFLDVDL